MVNGVNLWKRIQEHLDGLSFPLSLLQKEKETGKSGPYDSVLPTGSYFLS